MTVDLSAKRKVTRRTIQATIRSLTTSAKQYEDGGFPRAAAKCHELADRERAKLAAYSG